MLSSGLILRGRYRILRQIGRGGTSSVFLAEDVSIGKKWAVKFLPCDDDTVWLAQNEINMMIMLDHEMFPRIVDAWQDEEGYYIVSDYIEGTTLDRALCTNKVSRKMLIEWWMDIAAAIKYLHDRKPSILYLDLKLENIMLKADGSLRLIDFGIAGRIAERGSLYGTPGYAAPEQYYNRGELLDERTDVFAFGMLMYAMITGRPPVPDLKEQEKLVREERGIPGRIRTIILNCISEDKDERYPGMGELADAIRMLKGGGKKAARIRLSLAAAAAVTAIGIFGIAAVRYVLAEPIDNAAERMIAEVNEHIVDGEYTEEGIRIICGYIESGCLDDDSCMRFTYEVAKNYFLVRRNYREALRYFEMLDTELYPESAYYKQLCRLQMTFENDREDYVRCLEEFNRYNKGLGYDGVRYENYLMIANLYDALISVDGYDPKQEIGVLEDGLHDLRYAVREGLYTDDGPGYEAEYLRRLCILYEGAGDRTKAISYGEQAVRLMDPGQAGAADDIKSRLEVLRTHADKQ